MLALLVAVLAGVLVAPSPPDGHQVVLRVAADDAAGTWPVIDGMVDGDVLRVRVTGADDGAVGTVMQCTPSTCWNRYPVTFDDGGAARFQYQVQRRDCAPAASCSVRVEVGDGSAVALTVFGGPAPPAPEVVLAPAGTSSKGTRSRSSSTGSSPAPRPRRRSAPRRVGRARRGPRTMPVGRRSP